MKKRFICQEKHTLRNDINDVNDTINQLPKRHKSDRKVFGGDRNDTKPFSVSLKKSLKLIPFTQKELKIKSNDRSDRSDRSVLL